MGVVLAALPAAAGEEDTRDAREHLGRAKIHFKLREFDAATVEFREAYRLKPVPALLFNIAQCERMRGKYLESKFYYEQYLRDLPEASNLDEVRRQMAELTKLIQDEGKEPAASGVPAVPPPAPVAAPLVAPLSPPRGIVAALPPERPAPFVVPLAVPPPKAAPTPPVEEASAALSPASPHVLAPYSAPYSDPLAAPIPGPVATTTAPAPMPVVAAAPPAPMKVPLTIRPTVPAAATPPSPVQPRPSVAANALSVPLAGGDGMELLESGGPRGPGARVGLTKRRSAWPVVSLVLAAAGGGAGGYFGWSARTTHEAAVAAPFQSDAAAKADTAQASALKANVLFAVAGVAALAGLVGVFTW